MTDRVLMDQTGLRVSKAGWNVQTAPSKHLIFSSDANTMGVFMRGEFWLDQGAEKIIPFGATFPSAPTFLLGVFYSTGSDPWDYDVAGTRIHFDNQWTEQTYLNAGFYSFYIFNDRIHLINRQVRTLFKYLVMDYCA